MQVNLKITVSQEPGGCKRVKYPWSVGNRTFSWRLFFSFQADPWKQAGWPGATSLQKLKEACENERTNGSHLEDCLARIQKGWSLSNKYRCDKFMLILEGCCTRCSLDAFCSELCYTLLLFTFLWNNKYLLHSWLEPLLFQTVPGRGKGSNSSNRAVEHDKGNKMLKSIFPYFASVSFVSPKEQLKGR